MFGDLMEILQHVRAAAPPLPRPRKEPRRLAVLLVEG